MVPKIVLTGGPCAGKTSAKTFLLQKFGDRGYHPVFIPEYATLLMESNIRPGIGIFSERTFQRSCIELTHRLETIAERALEESSHGKPLLFLDRGIPDASTYIQEPGLYEKLLAELGLGTPVEVRDRRYKGVFHLRTAALGAEDFYTIANNASRLEKDPATARASDERTLQGWNGHPHLRVIDNSTDFAGKLKRLDREICSLLGDPVPLEIEKKYLCAPIDLGSIPVVMQKIEIEQVYVHSNDPDVVLRVRKRGQGGSFVYFKTEKRDLGPGVRLETESFITAPEYRALVKTKLPGTRPIRKHRYTFIFENQYFELDVIAIGERKLFLLELELTEERANPKLPSFIQVQEDVTEDRRFTNRALAEMTWLRM